MNTRYTETFLFLSRLSRRSNKGFALGFVFCAGVLMVGTAAVMLMRSSSEREKVIAQQTTAKGIMKADVGVARITYFLNQPQHQKLIKKPIDKWDDVVKEITDNSGSSGGSGSGSDSSGSQLEGAACNGSGGSSDSSDSDSGSSSSGSSGTFDTDMFNQLLNKEWITIKTSKDVSAGEYRLTGYELDSETDPKFVNLKVEARGFAQDGDTPQLKSNNSVRGINVLLPIIEKTEEEEEAESPKIPGLWIRDSNTSNKQNAKQSSGPQEPINAVTWLDCHQDKDWNKKDKGKYVSDFVHPGKIDQTAIKMKDGTEVIPSKDEKDMQVKDKFPDFPPIPNSSKVRNMGSVNWSNCYITLPVIEGNKSSCKNFSGTDEPIGNAYYYKFTGSDSMNLSSVQIRINPPEGKKVIIFASGIISISGTSNFNKHNKYYDEGEGTYKKFPQEYLDALKCRSGGGTQNVTAYIGDPTDPSKLEIYSSTSQEALKLQGQNMFSGFLFAPNTKVIQVSQSHIRGAAWVKAMDASNSEGSGCDRSVRQMDVGKTLVMAGDAEEGQPVTTLGQVASYQSTEAE